MSRPNGPGRPGRRATEPVELTVLHGWLRNAKGSRTFGSLARRATEAGVSVSECTLRRALVLDGRVPSRRTVLAFARGGGGADEGEAGLVWEAAAVAGRPRPARAGNRYVPGRFTTRAGMVEAMERMCAAAGNPTLDEMTAAGGGRFSRSALHNLLSGRRPASEQLVIDFSAAIGAGEKATQALLAGHARILAGSRPLAFYPCEIVDRAEERRQQDEAVRSWLIEPELGWDDQQLRAEEEAEHRRMIAWLDALTDAELHELQQQARSAAEADRDLRAELAGCLARTRPADEAGR
ncbi:hypothetical protein ABZ468_28125 [Streptomyces sp. NPDC005708]|uniref:hypothetical protein n=1 Tax=Streptomyces sp. NPDC005708 TaxID=3154564 RepID=UPI0033D32200